MPQKTPYLADENREASPAEAFDGHELLAILMERAWIGATIAIVVCLFFWLNAHRQTPYYRSTATLMVEAQIPKFMNYQDIFSFNTRNLEYFNTHLNALHSRKMMEAAIRAGGFAERSGFTPGLSDADQVEAALRMVSIEPVEKSRILALSIEHPDPQMASDFANALARAYIQQDLDERMKASMQAIEWLRERSEEYRGKMEKGLLQLQEYRETTESVSLEEDQNIVIAKLKALNSALTTAQTERIDAEAQWGAVQSQNETNDSLPALAATLQEFGFQETYKVWQDQRRKVILLRQRYKEGHPDLQQAVAEEKNLDDQIRLACGSSVQSLKSRYEVLKKREASLQIALRDQEKLAFELDRKLVRYNDMKRNVEADKEVYQAVIARMKEANLSGTMPMEIIRLVEEARPTQTPVRPNPVRALVRGAVFGLVLGLGVIFFLHYADRRFRRCEEVERILEVPVLGTIPLIESKSIKERGMVAHLDHAGEVAEAFRSLRVSLTMREGDRGADVLMVTSTHAGEGKSLVSTNLAISFAQDQKRTLLIGADLRRPSLQKILERESLRGLAEVLKGECSWREVRIQHEIPGLDVLPTVRIPSRPTELLGSRQFADLIREVRGEYDRVIIDAPPMLGVSDSLILLSNVDSVLFVVRYAVTPRLSAHRAAKLIRESGIRSVGVVMNGVNMKSAANYYYYRQYGQYTYTASKNNPVSPSGS